MGVEHYLVCQQCKEYIDLHKSYSFSLVIQENRPPSDTIGKHRYNYIDTSEPAGYWESRGLWFLWNHRGHKGIEMHYDDSDEWYELMPYLKEVFSHSDDLKIRESELK